MYQFIKLIYRIFEVTQKISLVTKLLLFSSIEMKNATKILISCLNRTLLNVKKNYDCIFH